MPKVNKMTPPTREAAQTKRILIVEDHPIFRMGLVDLIEQEPDFEVCGGTEDVNSSMKAIRAQEPDLVVLDLALKTSSGLDLLTQISAENKNLPVLVLSMHDEEVYAERCLHAGARGYINKKEASESVITAIRQILQGNVFLSANMTAKVLNKFQSKTDRIDDSPISRLTNRELEIFNLIGQGMVASTIAGRLHISVKTVYAHTERIKEKLGIRHSYELVRFAALAMEKETIGLSPDFE